jgi:proteasome lid subunit RPN8/RPN11
MRADVEDRAPEEACGLLAGLGGEVLEVIPVPNALRSPVRYRMDPKDQWRAFQTIEQRGWELVGIYHSHPDGPETPSETDVTEAFYPEAAYLIWSKRVGTWRCQAFHIESGRALPVPISGKAHE